MKTVLKVVAGLAVTTGAAGLAASAPPGPTGEQPRTPTPPPAAPTPPDLTKQPTLYVVGYAHLDTQWRWTYVDTIKEYIPNTLKRKFALFYKYPSYIFNFTGSRPY